MKRYAFIGYRKWAYQILKNLLKFQKKHSSFSTDTIITTPMREFRNETSINKCYIVNGNDDKKIYKILKANKIDVAIFYGWSWIVKEPILSDFICLCLHPAPLPKYRGGTPIQNQIINGKTASAVTIFKMKKGIDDGDIYAQIPISLRGNVKDIFDRMIKVGTKITKNFILDLDKDKVVFTPQKGLDKNPPWKRRTPEQSEIKITVLNEMSFFSLNNLVRALTDPYPNTYIQLTDGRIYFQKVEKHKKIKKHTLVLDFNTNIKGLYSNKTQIFLKLKDCYARIKDYRIERI